MKRKSVDIERIQHMIDAILKIDKFTEDMDFAAFLVNEMAQYAVIKNFEIIGEAAYQISPDLKERYSQVEWRKIEGMRHILVHDYYRINAELLWNTKEEKLNDLNIQLLDIMDNES
ncbi:MAG: DUF86 domain-containing protein [Lewinellaceae bacterium]|nr:DUF86 domain-containing protein [Lewinellaceae bacterium]